MSNVDQLLAKAMSTASEEEAIACLRMARKRGGQPAETQSADSKDVSYWKNKAQYYYEAAVMWQKTAKIERESQSMWHKYYEESIVRSRRLKVEKDSLEIKLLNHKMLLGMLVVTCFGLAMLAFQ